MTTPINFEQFHALLKRADIVKIHGSQMSIRKDNSGNIILTDSCGDEIFSQNLPVTFSTMKIECLSRLIEERKSIFTNLFRYLFFKINLYFLKNYSTVYLMNIDSSDARRAETIVDEILELVQEFKKIAKGAMSASEYEQFRYRTLGHLEPALTTETEWFTSRYDSRDPLSKIVERMVDESGDSDEEFSIDDKVKVVKIIDEEGEEKYIGQSGVVVKNNNVDGFPEGVCVKFTDGKTDMFWPEELEKLS